MVEDVDSLKRRVFLETITVATGQYIKHGFSDHSMIKLISFSSVQKQLSMPSAILKSHCHNTTQLDWLILPATRSRKERKSRERADLANAGNLIADIW